MTDTTMARLAAADPLPDGAALDEPARERLLARAVAAAPARRSRRRLLAVAAAAAAVAVPAAAFADDIGGFLGIANPGTPAATTAVAGLDSGLAKAMNELRFPSQIADLGVRDGFHFYVARGDGGTFCFTISAAGAADLQHPKVIGCAPADYFPAETPLLDFSTGMPNGGFGRPHPGDHVIGAVHWDDIRRLVGFAADGVASVALLDADGGTIARTPVSGNVYLDENVPAMPAAAVVALDAQGTVLYRIAR
ncbi:MAG TPA: hypothetical protein VFL66_03800 [Gaiellaceae bacterium]|nr:hypothetical protein [Gaiellaceae bacterium]